MNKLLTILVLSCTQLCLIVNSNNLTGSRSDNVAAMIKTIENNNISSYEFDETLFNDEKLKECIDIALERHNHYRKKHGVEPLVISEQLNAVSQAWANKLASDNKGMVHSHDPKYGENLYWMMSTNPVSFNQICKDGVTAWYDEIEFWDFSKSEEELSTIHAAFHFTQVIWKISKKLGTGVAYKDQNYYMVSNYEPPGNLIGSFKLNVLPSENDNGRAAAVGYSKLIFLFILCYYTFQIICNV